MELKELNKENFDEIVASETLPMMIDFWGPQCVPCLALMPTVEKLAGEFEGKVSFYKVNTAENRRLAMKLKVIGLPTFLFYKGGERVDVLTGEFDEADIIEKLNGVL